jgi:hypothetical protein
MNKQELYANKIGSEVMVNEAGWAAGTVEKLVFLGKELNLKNW